MWPRRRFAWIGALLVLSGSPHQPSDIRTFLTSTIGLTAADLRALDRGDPVIRSLNTGDQRDMSIFGVVAFKSPQAFLVRDVASALRAQGRLTFSILHDPAIPGDVAAISVPAKQARALRDCRPGSCGRKLSAADMVQLRELLGRTGDSTQATLFEQRRFLSIVAAYRQGGNISMPTFDDDKTRPVNGGHAFESLEAETPFLYAYAPGLREYLLGYPQATLSGAQDTLYWVRDEIPGLDPVTSFDERVAFSPPGAPETPEVTIVATKQIVADHYLEAGLEVVVAIQPSPTGRAPGYVMFIRQYRFDHIPNTFPLYLRGRVVSKLRDRAKTDLLRIRDHGS